MSNSSSNASSSKVTFAIIALAATALIAVSAYAYNTSRTSENKSKPIDFDKKRKDNTPVKSNSEDTSVVEDVNYDDDDDDDDDAEEEDEASSKKKIDQSIQDASSLAAKCFQDGKYNEAVSKYSEAIEYATKATWSKDTVKLYANRAAAYEKAGDFNNSLLDVETVLRSEFTNTKARIRKTRILEAQNNFNDALYETFVVFNIFMKIASTNTDPSQAETLNETVQALRNSMDKLTKVVTANEVKSYMSQKFHQKLPKDLPIRSACRAYFELTPTYHQWQCLYKGNKRHSYENKNESITLEQKLVLVYYDIANGFYKNAFDELDNINPDLLANESNVILSQYYEMKGTEKHLKGDAKSAISFYEQAIQSDNNNYVSCIKLANVHGQDNDDKVKANEIYDSLLANTEVNDVQTAIKNMFIRLNIVSLSSAKDEVTGQPRIEDLHKNITVINDIITMAQKFSNDHIIKVGHFLALIRKIMANAHIKLLSALPENTNITEEKVNVERFFHDMIGEAKELCPDNEVVLSIEADICALTGDIDKALRLMDDLKDKAPNYDSSPYTAKASILTQKMNQLQQLYYESHGNDYYISSIPQIIEEVTALYKHAIDQESNSVEAYYHYANFLLMTNDFESANKNVIEAFNYLRNKDEVAEIVSLKVQIEMQLKTIDYLKKKHFI